MYYSFWVFKINSLCIAGLIYLGCSFVIILCYESTFSDTTQKVNSIVFTKHKINMTINVL